MNKTLIARSLAIMGGLALSQTAGASGFQLLEQNASGLGNAYAGSAASAENASIIFYNPAGMTELKDREFSLGMSLIKPSYKFKDNGSSNAPAATGGDGGDAGSLAALPNAYFSMALARDWYLGLGLGSPFGLKTDYSPDWTGRFQSIKFDIKTYNINPSLAWRVTDTLSLGAGLNWQRMEAQYERMAATASSALPSAFWPTLQGTRVALDATSEGWGWNAGALFKPSARTRIGFSYRSAIKHDLGGTLKSTNQAISPDVLATASLKLPDTYILSVAQQISPRWEMLGDISRTGWSKINTIDIVRASGSASGSTAQTLDARFRDTWRVALGANYRLDDKWKLRYGIAWDQSPVRSASERLVSLPDNNRIWLSLGAGYALDKDSRIDVGAAYLIIKDTAIDNNQTSLGRGRIAGKYEGSVAILGLQYSQAF
jgi:long-chain fatty acid transport protein